jgi:hypothetical protein
VKTPRLLPDVLAFSKFIRKLKKKRRILFMADIVVHVYNPNNLQIEAEGEVQS